MMAEDPEGTVHNVVHGTERSGVNMRSSLWVLEVGATLDQGACCLQSVTSWISSFKNMTAKLEDPN